MQIYIYSGPDRPPSNLSSQAINITALTVYWGAVPTDYTNGILRGYRIALFKFRNQEFFKNYTILDADIFSLNVTGLDPGAAYNTRICAFTIKGNGNWSEVEVVFTESTGNIIVKMMTSS